MPFASFLDCYLESVQYRRVRFDNLTGSDGSLIMSQTVRTDHEPGCHVNTAIQ